jgi:hypothetical protein
MTSTHLEPSTRTRRSFVAIVLTVIALTLAACTPTPPAADPTPPDATVDCAGAAHAPRVPAPAADPLTILGTSELTATQIAAYLTNPSNHLPAWRATVDQQTMAECFINEGADEGVRGDIAFCQSILETGWFSFPGYSDPPDNNFAGIGAFTGSTVYMTQPTAGLGIRAQIQHLANYAGRMFVDLAHPLVPRPGYTTQSNYDSFKYKGAAPNWVDLNGKWAVPGTTYAQTILAICNQIRVASGLGALTSSAIAGLSTVTDDPIFAAETQQLQNVTERN